MPARSGRGSLSGDHLVLLSLGQPGHHQVVGMIDELQHVLVGHRAVERHGVLVPLAEVVTGPVSRRPSWPACGGTNRSHAIYALQMASADEGTSTSVVRTKREESDAQTLRQTLGTNRIPGPRDHRTNRPKC